MPLSRRRIAVRGLVRLRERVRAELARGLTEQAAAELRGEVETAVAEVHRGLAASGLSARHLAAPSRSALADLERTDFAATGSAALPARVRVSGVVAAHDQIVDAATGGRLTAEAARAEAGRIARECEAAVESMRQDREIELAGRTREALAALRELGEPGEIERRIDGHRRLAALATAAWRSDPRRAALALAVRWRRGRALWRLIERRDGAELRVLDGFAGAPDDLLEALVRWAIGRDPAGRGALEDWLVAKHRPRPWGPPARAAGIVHDLGELFERVNRERFSGRLARPALAWSAAPTRNKFGHYARVDDRIVLSSTLDAPEVPPWVVEFVLFHEMLHKELGIERSGGRGRAHTAEFRRREREFPRHAEATRFLERLGRRR